MEQVQRTIEWHEARNGKFTASETHKLLGIKGLGETGKTYAFEKAIEQLFGKMEENYISYDMQNGIDTEPLAFEKFKQLKGMEFLTVQNCGFYPYEDHAGGSPDGIVSDNAVLEIKCPKATTFFKLVATGIIDPKYIAQMQMQMLATGTSKAYFFNYLIHEGTEYWHEIVVERDEVMISKIRERLAEAIIEKTGYIDKILANKQF
jgi:exodeoxyribonuclease (lambda-induced)